MSDPVYEQEDRLDMSHLMAGHDAGLDRLMERHGEKLLHYLIRLVQDEAEAADLAQESFVRVFQHRDRFRPHQKFSTWLYTIATNLARDRLRWRNRHPQVPLEAENPATGSDFKEILPANGPSPSDVVQADETAALVRRAVAALPEELRLPLILSEYEERSQAEIAAILACSIKAVEMRLYRARNQLRGRLENLLMT